MPICQIITGWPTHQDYVQPIRCQFAKSSLVGQPIRTVLSQSDANLPNHHWLANPSGLYSANQMPICQIITGWQTHQDCIQPLRSQFAKSSLVGQPIRTMFSQSDANLPNHHWLANPSGLYSATQKPICQIITGWPTHQDCTQPIRCQFAKSSLVGKPIRTVFSQSEANLTNHHWLANPSGLYSANQMPICQIITGWPTHQDCIQPIRSQFDKSSLVGKPIRTVFSQSEANLTNHHWLANPSGLYSGNQKPIY